MVAAEIAIAVFVIQPRYPEPWDLGVHMVNKMEIIVQKQKRQQTPIFDDYRSSHGLVMRSMLKEGAYLQQRQRAIT